MSYLLSLDIGGTKIATVVANETGEIVSRVEYASVSSDREAMFAQVVKSIEEALIEAGITVDQVSGMGLGVPGKINRDEGIAVFQNNLPWENFPVVERLKEEFPIDHIVLDNDVYMATFAEWQALGGNEQDTFVYMTVSTGISIAVIHEGSFLRGAGFAGEAGLLPMTQYAEENNPHYLTLENVASGSAVQAKAQEVYRDPNFTSKELFERYDENDEQAVIIIEQMAKDLAYGLYPIICLLDPSQIVFGGGVINHQPKMLDLIKEFLHPYLIAEQKSSLQRLKTSQYKGNAGVMGGIYQAMKK